LEAAVTVPLIVAFLGAGLGAYFAFLKTRKERLWSDRYDAIRNVVLSLEKIQANFEAREMHERGVQVVTPKECEVLEEDWPTARQNLRVSIITLRLLFKDQEITALLERHQELDQAFLLMFGGTTPEYTALFGEVAKNAEQAIEEAIRLAQKRCL
jgi:hypothetical protein